MDNITNPQELYQTMEMLKSIYGAGAGGLAPDVTKDFTTSLGLIPYNLEGGAKLLAPVITPLRNTIPRTKGKGKATEFLAITSYNQTGVTGWAAEGVSNPNNVVTTSVHVTLPYRIASQKNLVTFESQYYGNGQVDAKALAVANLLRASIVGAVA